MAGRLVGKVALITGGTSGIGEASAELFAAEGAAVVLTGRSQEKGAALASRIGPGATYHHADVSNQEDIKNSIGFTLEQHGRLDILFNNAGGPTPGNVDSITSEEIDYGVQLLLRSVMLGTRYAIEPMKALRYGQGSALYSVLKAAVTHYTRLAAVELGPHSIRVNAISPGAIATPVFWRGSASTDALDDADTARKMAKLQRNLAKATPIPRSGLAVDIAEAALFLASDAGSFVNGHDLIVDGGRTSLFNEAQ